MTRALQNLSLTTLLLVTVLAAAYAQPTYTSAPAAAATGVNQTTNIILTFNEAVQAIPGNTTLTDANVGDYIHLRLTNTAGADIPFVATINPGKTVITIDPVSELPSGAVIFVEPITLEAVSDDDDMVPASFTFTVATYPVPAFNPTNGAVNVAIASNLTITFSEAVRKLDNSPITPADLLTLIELKLTNDAGAGVPFTATIDGTNTIITIDPTSNLNSTTLYYLEINPIEDVTDNATTAQNITFTTIDGNPPVPTFSPLNAATGVVETSNITITFDEPIRKIDDSPITPADLATLIELKLTNNGGAAVAFTASIDGTNTIVTIDPTPILTQNTVYYVEINPVEDASNNATTATNITFTTGNTLPPTIAFSPVNGAVNVALAANLTITFNEAVRKLDDSPITSGDLSTLVELKLTNNAGSLVPFTATIDGTNTVITVDPTSNLTSGTLYYLEVNPVEDGGNNAITATNITFTTIDVNPPVPTFNPINGAAGVLEGNNITITFDEPIRKLDDSPITPADLATLVELKLTNNAGANVPFTATIGGGNTVVTIDPTATLTSSTLYYVEINPVEDASNNATTAANITFTTGDSQPPAVTFSPTGGSINFSAQGNITITFTEAIRKTDDSPITVGDLATLVELKLTNNGGAAVPFTPSINGGNTIITINPNATLLHNQIYYVEINPVEDAANNAITAQNITFTTEDRPSITAFLPAAAERCIGDDVTINGLRFAGTGNPTSGNTQPTVYVNAVAVPSANIVSFNATQVVFTLPSMTPGTYPITVRNNDSDLLSAGSNFDVRPAINTGLTVTPATLSPAQNTNVNVTVATTQDNNYSYSLILTAAPGGYSLTPPATVHTLAGNSGSRTLNTAEGPDPDLTHVGDYTYRIDVSRTNCVTRTLSNTPFTLSVASLAVSVNATDVTVCAGSTTTLIGSASGGTGFYQFRWTSLPAGYTSSASSPTVTPPGNIRYILEVEDNAGNIVSDFIDVTSVPLPTVTIDPVPGESTVRTNYTIEDRYYQLYGSPTGGTFSGPGVALIAGTYYFNPNNAGTGIHDIVYTFTDGAGCAGSDTEQFNVSAASVNGLNLSYCQNVIIDPDALSPVAASIPVGWQFTRLVFYSNGCTAEAVPLYFSNCGLPNPLSVTNSAFVVDIQSGTPVLRPTTYSLDLDIIRNSYGYSSSNSFYILVYAKNASGIEDYVTYQFFRVLENGPAPQIVGINEGQAICSDRTPINLTSSIPGYTVASFSITPGFSASLTTPAGVFSPGNASLTGADERFLNITMNYSDFNNCPSSVTRNFVWVKKPSLINASDTSFCQFADPVTFKIESDPNGLGDRAYWYDEDPALPGTVLLDSINFTFKVPGIDGQNDFVEDFFVLQSYKGCKGNSRQINFIINPAPDATITNSPICEDKVFNLSGPEENPGVPYAQYEWFFGDGVTETLLNDNTTTYNYGPNSANTLKTITLVVTTGLGCTATDEIANTVVSPNPKPDFSYQLVCENDVTRFNGSSDINTFGTTFQWDFGDGITIPQSLAGNSAPEGGTSEDPFHKLAIGSGDYDVTITTYTPTGCFASLTKTVTILDTLIRTTTNPYTMTPSEDGGKGFWRLEDINGNSSWEFNTPTKSVMNEFTSSAWVTDAAGPYSSDEYSFLNSPCFNISTIDRPVLSLDYVLNTQAGTDGLVVEFSKDGGITWSPLGNVNSGFNWFNTNGFTIGNIGNSSFGWSGNSWELPDNVAADTLVQGRRALDNIPGLLTAGDRANLRLRLAFKTNGEGELNGFAFNNMTIGTRNRVLLVENFTNIADPNYVANNTAYKAIPFGEVVKIQYHVSAPGDDPNYTFNMADPSARAAFYGIPLNANTIPRGYVDGYSNGDFISALWVQNTRDQRSLKVAPFDIAITSLQPEDASYLKVAVNVSALQDIPQINDPILHIAVVQQTEGVNEYVLRKLIPAASGTKLPKGMNSNDNFTVIDSVRIEDLSDAAYSDLAVVAFVQDENGRQEVYQAAINDNLTFLPDPDLITGTEDPEYVKNIHVYPNPANQLVNIELPAGAAKPTPVVLIDAFGKTVYQSEFRIGEKTKAVSTETMADGIYMLQLTTPGGSKAVRKVMVKH